MVTSFAMATKLEYWLLADGFRLMTIIYLCPSRKIGTSSVKLAHTYCVASFLTKKSHNESQKSHTGQKQINDVWPDCPI